MYFFVAKLSHLCKFGHMYLLKVLYILLLVSPPKILNFQATKLFFQWRRKKFVLKSFCCIKDEKKLSSFKLSVITNWYWKLFSFQFVSAFLYLQLLIASYTTASCIRELFYKVTTLFTFQMVWNVKPLKLNRNPLLTRY